MDRESVTAGNEAPPQIRPARVAPVRGGVALRHRLLARLNAIAIPFLSRAGGSNFFAQAAELQARTRMPLAERETNQLKALNLLMASATRVCLSNAKARLPFISPSRVTDVLEARLTPTVTTAPRL